MCVSMFACACVRACVPACVATLLSTLASTYVVGRVDESGELLDDEANDLWMEVQHSRV